MDKNEMKHIELIDKVLPIQPDFELKTVRLFNIDCMLFMKEIPDNYYELAIVDPPYGIGFGKFNRTNKDSSGKTYKANKYKNSNWDNAIPDERYFKELMRVSQNQIIWGGNYFPVLWGYGGKCFLFWHKANPVPNFSDGELAWTSFNKVARQIDLRYYGNLEGKTSASKKYHPTQKPIQLYKWLFTNYAKKGDKIFDSHGGSFSSACACLDMGFEFDGCEIDKEYFNNAVNRLKNNVQDYFEFT